MKIKRILLSGRQCQAPLIWVEGKEFFNRRHLHLTASTAIYRLPSAVYISMQHTTYRIRCSHSQFTFTGHSCHNQSIHFHRSLITVSNSLYKSHSQGLNISLCLASFEKILLSRRLAAWCFSKHLGQLWPVVSDSFRSSSESALLFNLDKASTTRASDSGSKRLPTELLLTAINRFEISCAGN